MAILNNADYSANRITIPKNHGLKDQITCDFPSAWDKKFLPIPKLKSGTLHSPVVGTYRTKDGLAYYKFRYIKIRGFWEIDILEQPSYKNKDSGAHATHRLNSSRGGKKICLSSGHEPRTLLQAQEISTEWSELTHSYIKTGKTIDTQVTDKNR